MPNYQDHLLFGSILVLVFSYLIGPYLSYSLEAVIVSAALILLAAIFPDIDHKNSIVHRKMRALLVLLAGAVPMVGGYPNPVAMIVGGVAAAVGVYYTFEWLKPRHRTVTHTFKFCVGFSTVTGVACLIAFNTFLPALFVFVSYLSHLVLDGTVP